MKIFEEPHFCHILISHNNHLHGIAASTSQLSYTFDPTSSNSPLKSLIFLDYMSGWSSLCGTVATTITNSCGNLLSQNENNQTLISQPYFNKFYVHIFNANNLEWNYQQLIIISPIIHACAGLWMSLLFYTFIFSFSNEICLGYKITTKRQKHSVICS